MKAFVTGSTGLLGNNLVRLLVEQGHEVKALARSRKKAELLFAGLDVDIVEGDMLDIPGFAAAMEGCEVLFHAAAYFRDYYQPGDHWKLLDAINIQGTHTLLIEAERHGIQRVIYTSSSTVIGAQPSGQDADESTPSGQETQWNLYAKSKLLAEKAVYQFLQNHSLPVVLILPALMFGPGDIGPTSTGLMVQNFIARKIPGIIDAGFSVVDARDVAQAMLAAVEKGKSGERYIVGGRYLDMAEIFQKLEQASGVPSPRRTLPYSVTLIIAWLSETIARITHQTTLMTRDSVRTSHLKRRVSSQKALHELGIIFRPVEETLRDEIDWYRAHSSKLAF
ncbi:dihydroflavonol-4-reductase [Reticulibacter mediterranei]|uniref:Dihydroflavonol-4-reductase n=1 Tax=Reticulibacter mediterranei TaxID=2778369 RepID=A0A8J3IEL1_9CHLR|nr:SDR family oxidoreductase [Reticulibacter mediterranei]GHO92133.1 dihydroflavonol-4-reductase [Reticulibacter mediterranei]